MTSARPWLTDKQARFVQEFLVDLNGTQAAVRAGYSARTANRTAFKLLQHDGVKAELAKRQRQLVEKLEITQERVVAELRCIAFSDIRDFVDWDEGGIRVKHSTELSTVASRCLKNVSNVQRANSRLIKVELHDKLGALHRLGIYLGMWGMNKGKVNPEPARPPAEPLSEDEEFELLERYAELVEKRKRAKKRLGYDREGNPINVRR